MNWETRMTSEFPEAIPQGRFLAQSYEALQRQGFRPENTIAFACVCRDEITWSLVEDVERIWGEAFLFSGLGGLPILGKTGFLAAQQHAPIDESGLERYVYYALPHIAIGPEGEFGVYFRPGRQQASHACGALIAIQHELESRSLHLVPDPDDIEQSILKRHLLGKLRYGDVPDLLSLTRIAHGIILEEIERMIHLTVDPTRSNYGVFTGIQIHAPEGRHFVWPGTAYVVMGGKQLHLSNVK